MSVELDERIVEYIRKGFSYDNSKKLVSLIDSGEYEELESWRRELIPDSAAALSVRDILFAQPIADNVNFLNDRLSMRYCLDEYRELFPEYYYVILTKKGEKALCRLPDLAGGYKTAFSSVVRLLEAKGSLATVNASAFSSVRHTLRFVDEDCYTIDGREHTRASLIGWLKRRRDNTIIMQAIEDTSKRGDCINLCFLNDERGRKQFVEGFYSPWDRNHEVGYYGIDFKSDIPDLKNIIRRLCNAAELYPLMEYVNFNIVLCEGGFYIDRIFTGAELTLHPIRSQALADFIEKRIEQKKNEITEESIENNLLKYEYTLKSEGTGYDWHMLRGWEEQCELDFLESSHTPEEIAWCHEKGFFSFRLEQYGLCEENCDKIISDRDYRFVRPLNPVFKKVVRNKISPNHMLRKFNVFPKNYFTIVPRDGCVTVYREADCPDRYKPCIKGVIGLLRSRGELAVKRIKGAHGVGFMKLEHARGAYFVNGERHTKAELIAILSSLESTFLVSEFIRNAKIISDIYPRAVSTARIMMINDSGSSPVIADAYMRIASEESGYTDNVASGGIVAKIDVNTGSFGSGQSIRNHVYEACPVHPDTGTAIEGRLPCWDKIKETLLEISAYLSPLEYLGFDVAVTPDGFRLLEINNHQDLHKANEYPDFVNRYLLDKVEEKRKRVTENESE